MKHRLILSVSAVAALLTLGAMACQSDDPSAPSAPEVAVVTSPQFSFDGTEPPSETSPLDDLARNPSRSGYPHPLESSQGWGGGADKWDIVEGRRYYSYWANGLAFTGGTRPWIQPCGWRHATINFGAPRTFNQVVVWHHGRDHVPNTYNIQYWNGTSWVVVFSTTSGHDYLNYPPGPPWNWWNSWSTPTVNAFDAVTGSKVRFELYNCDITHGWIYEFEVYHTPTNQPPTAEAGGPYTGDEGSEIPFDGSGSSDPDNNIVLYEWDLDYDGAYNDATGVTAAGAYADNGTYTVGLRVTDEFGESDTDDAEVTVVNVVPTLTVAAASVSVDEGDPAANSGTVDDPGEDVVTLSASVGTVNDNGDGTWSWGLLTSDGPSESQTVTITATDDDGGTTSMTFDLVVTNVAPTVGPITAPYDPVSVGTPINASAGFTDPGTADTHTAQWDWNWDYGDTGPGTVTQGAGSGSVDDSHTYAEPGLYKIQLTVTDDDFDSDEELFEYVVVYDPSGGFVTGGGWIYSQQGAYMPDHSLEGKATFGFVSKYKKGATVPTGQTEFQFRVADLNFHSSSYDWLVVTGSNYARFKGSGTINGMGKYEFMLWAGDGSPDTFRIRIWEEDEFGVETVTYDNNFDQAIGAGSVVVHTK